MKYIYLDQNKWIELAKGLKERNNIYISLYETIVKNVKDGIWAFPLSSIHINEAMKRRNETSRKQLLNLMFSVSNGYAICDYITADNIEFNTWINNKIVSYSQLKGEIIKHDWAAIIGLSTENADIKFSKHLCSSDEMDKIKQIIKKHSCDREIFDLICNVVNDNIKEDEAFYYRCYEEGRKSFLLWKNRIKGSEEYKDKYLYPAYLINVFFEVYKERITNLSSRMKINITELFRENSKNKTKAIANLEALPGFNVYNRLIFELYNNPDKKVHEHDFNDLAYLRIAIPYCDIVIGENYWCDRVRHYSLDKKYNTIVNTKLLSLISG
ncbi:hypothetical protein [uncultured Clostridium sp.]|uniref:hypothetical protein n=1 Tax=uncultured Clostridium sp. TaxID=59620 RepID=UPI0025D985F3|nr:hypothetical protein [uncultured Clostridium sp.]